MDKRERAVFILEIRTGISFKVRNYTEAVRWTGASSKGAVSNAIRSGYNVKGRYVFKNEKFTKEEKRKHFEKYWEENKAELLGERWAQVVPGLTISSLGRVKTDGKFYFPNLSTDNNSIRVYYKYKTYKLIRNIMELHKIRRPLKDNEMVFRNGNLFDYDVMSLRLGTFEEYRRRGARSRSQEVAKLDENGEIIEMYSSVREAAKQNYTDASTISLAIREDRECLGMKFVKMDNLY